MYDKERRPVGRTNHENKSEDPQQQSLRQRAMMKRARGRSQGAEAQGKEAPIPEAGGRPLPGQVRARMQPKSASDLSAVQVHTGDDSAKAAEGMGAKAFTVDNHVHFNRGEFAPGTREGDRLIAHELAHVAQAQAGQVQCKSEAETSDSPLEADADQQADQMTDELHKDDDGEKPAAEGEGQEQDGAQAEKHEQIVQAVMAADETDRSTATKIKDDLLVGAGEALGVAELLGLRYNVTAYEAQVSGDLFRGSRVDGKGMASLKAQGVKGIVSFCMENNDDAKPAEALGLNHLRIPILDNSAPNEEQVKEFLQFVKDGNNQPTYCHCEAGKGRTGTMVACYRIAVDGYSAEQAIAEGKGFGLELINQIDFIEKFAADVANGTFSA